MLPFQGWRIFLEFIHGTPADAFQYIEFGGTQRGQVAGFIFDRAVHNFIDKGQLVRLPANWFLVPVFVIFTESCGIALHIVAEHERAGAVGVFPIACACVRNLFGYDAGKVPPTEAVVPFGVVVFEGEKHRVFVCSLDFFNVVKVGRYFFRALVQSCKAVNHIVGDQFTCFHDTRFFREHHALSQFDFDAEGVIHGFPTLGQFTADAVGGQPGIGHKRVFAAFAHRFIQVGGKQLLVHQAGILAEFPSPVGWVPAKWRKGDVDHTDVQRAAILRLFHLGCCAQ